MYYPSRHSSWKRLKVVFCLRLQKTSSRRLQDVLMKANIFLLIIRLQKTSSRRLQDVLVKTNIFVLSIRLQDVFKIRFQDVFKTSCENVFKTSSRHLQGVLPRRLQDVFKTSSKRLANTSWRHLQDVFKTYHQVKLFLLTSLWEIFNMFVRLTAKTVVYRRIHIDAYLEPSRTSTMELFLRKYLKPLSC